jgi:hypothetical protein
VAAKMRATGGTIAHGPFKLQPHGEEVVIVQVRLLRGREACVANRGVWGLGARRAGERGC